MDYGKWCFYLAFSLFRLLAIIQGVYKRGSLAMLARTSSSHFLQLAFNVAK